MATLAEQRAQIAEGMRRSRQGTSEASRRATGQAMIERRTGRAEVDDINAVVRQPRQRTALPTLAPRGSVPAQTGTGVYNAPPAPGAGGLAWPLTEDDASAREFYDSGRIVSSADGLIAIRLRNMRSITLRDSNDETGQIVFAEPI